ncbi:MAG: SDR family NAD(P)-dependent oxidoreductase [Halobacteriaceae archaeon]
MDVELSGRTALVTGAASGIGRRVATRLADVGAAVAVADRREAPKTGEHYDRDLSTPTADLIRERDGTARFYETDVSAPEEVAALVAAVADDFGGLDVLVNNAGILVPGDSQSASVADFERVVAVNLTGQFLTARHAVPHLRASPAGRVVNVSSINAHFGGAGPAYAATKAGVVNLTRDLAVELADDGVTANCVLPGVIETPMQDLNDAETRAREREKTPLDRLGRPADVAAAVAFFASDDAAWVTGAELAVDGGYLAAGH